MEYQTFPLRRVSLCDSLGSGANGKSVNGMRAFKSFTVAVVSFVEAFYYAGNVDCAHVVVGSEILRYSKSGNCSCAICMSRNQSTARWRGNFGEPAFMVKFQTCMQQKVGVLNKSCFILGKACLYQSCRM